MPLRIMLLNIHSFIERSTENGPGIRAVLWVQGCTLECPGCFNPDTHAIEPHILMSTEELTRKILRISGIEGITISGGEPFQQAGGLAELAGNLRPYNLGIIVFSGFTLEQISQAEDPDWEALLAYTDVLIAGPFDKSLACHLPLRGSSNQTLHFLTERYNTRQEEFSDGANSVEVLIDPTGQIVVTGFPDQELL